MNSEQFLRRVTNRVREIRLEKGLTQSQCAGETLAIRNYQKLENGEFSPTLKTLFGLAQNMQVQPREFLSFDIPLKSDRTRKKGR